MHEMSIALQIIKIAIESVPKDLKANMVESVNLKVGKLSSVVPDSLTFCFEIASKDTILEGAILKIEEVPVILKCRNCNFKWEIDTPVFTCIKCNSGLVDIISGKELDIISIELCDDK